MRSKSFPASNLVSIVTALIVVAGLQVSAQAAEELKIQALLVWGTDDVKPPPGKDYKPLDPQIQKRLRALKWKHYFEVKRVDFTASTAGATKVPISEKCELNVTALGNSNVEVVFYGKGKEVARVKGRLPKNEILVPGGDAPNETAWLVILRRMD